LVEERRESAREKKCGEKKENENER